MGFLYFRVVFIDRIEIFEGPRKDLKSLKVFDNGKSFISITLSEFVFTSESEIIKSKNWTFFFKVTRIQLDFMWAFS